MMIFMRNNPQQNRQPQRDRPQSQVMLVEEHEFEHLPGDREVVVVNAEAHCQAITNCEERMSAFVAFWERKEGRWEAGRCCLPGFDEEGAYAAYTPEGE
jgi:hypothetical protein